MATTSSRGFTRAQYDELWVRLRAGETRRAIARALGKAPGSVHFQVLQAGGIPPRRRLRSAHALSLTEREVIARALGRGATVRQIAEMLGRAPSSISREVQRHGGRDGYNAERADVAAWEKGRRPKACRLATHPRLCALVAAKLRLQWSPRQISGWLRSTFPTAPELYVSPETIYRSLFVQARGVLKKELQRDLRTRRATRHAPRADGDAEAAGARSDRRRGLDQRAS